MKLLVWLVMLLGAQAYAQNDQIVVDGGIGVFHSAEHSLSETKMLTIGVQEDIFGPLKDRLLGGGYLDNSGNGKKSSALVAGQLGFEVNRNGLIAGVFSGPCVISTPDVLLGGRFQFMDDLHLGIQDNDNNYFGVMLRHISSAGIETPNVGRDIFAIELRF